MWISANWIKLKVRWQDASYRRLALALGLSLLLHLFLIGKFNFNLPNLSEKSNLIEARLLIPKVVPHQKPAVKKQTAVNQAELKKPVEVKYAAPLESSAPPDFQPTLPTEPPPVDVLTPIDSPDVLASVAENQIEEMDLIDKPKPYLYIDSEFDVYTDKGDGPNRSASGSARVIYQILPSIQMTLKL